jgi:hypothetical protein
MTKPDSNGEAPSAIIALSSLLSSLMWPTRIHDRFTRVPPNPQEADFHGPYNKLLNHVFPPDSDYTVIPRYKKTHSRGSLDYIVCYYEVVRGDGPVFVLELKAPAALETISGREEADDQMRRRLGDLMAACPLDQLHGVSAIGTRLSFYTFDKGTQAIDPPGIARHHTLVNDVAPADRWDTDLLTAEGQARLQTLFDSICTACAAL